MADMHPNPLQAYATYPYKSENYYGFPQMPDILITYYRTDILCHEEEQKNFQAKYNTEAALHARGDGQRRLGSCSRRSASSSSARRATCSPASPADDDFYGIAYQAGKGYDFISMQINGFIWQYGAGILGRNQGAERSGRRCGELAETAVKALDHYLRLTKYMPPVVKTGRHGHLQDRRAVP